MNTPFKPPFFLKNKHLQTMLADFIAIGLSPKNIEHGCWGIPRLSRRLAQVPTRSQRPIKLIIPGIEGVLSVGDGAIVGKPPSL